MNMLTKNLHGNVFFTHAQIYNGRIDFHEILHIHFLGGRSDIFESPIAIQICSGVLGGWGCEIWRLPSTLSSASNTAYCAAAHIRVMYDDEFAVFARRKPAGVKLYMECRRKLAHSLLF